MLKDFREFIACGNVVTSLSASSLAQRLGRYRRP